MTHTVGIDVSLETSSICIHISKQGDALARQALYEAANVLLTRTNSPQHSTGSSDDTP